MRAVDRSLVSQNLIITESVLEKQNTLRKRKTYEKEEEKGNDGRTGGHIGRLSGRGREEVRRAAGGRERRWRKRRKKEEKEERQERAGNFRKINRRAGKKLALDRERHVCRKKCNVLLWRRDTSRAGDMRQLRGHGNPDDLKIYLVTASIRFACCGKREKEREQKRNSFLYYISAKDSEKTYEENKEERKGRKNLLLNVSCEILLEKKERVI